jgi:hypothetical protein
MFASDLVAVTAWAASILVVGSGLGKLRRPLPASRALATAGFPSGVGMVRALGLAEAAVGGGFALRPGVVSGMALAGLYVGFAAFLVVLLRRPDASLCGCLGDRFAPPSPLHVALDVAAAGAAIGVAALAATGSTTPGLVTQAVRLGWAGVPFALGLGLAAWLAVLAVAHLPALYRSFERTQA